MKHLLWYDLNELTDYVNIINDKYDEPKLTEVLQPLLEQLWQLKEQLKNKGSL
jgi:hypothetical protein